MLFSATLDNGIDVIVKRYLTIRSPTRSTPAESPVGHDEPPRVARQYVRSAPRRSSSFLRTWPHDGVHPHQARAKQLTKQLNAHGVPAVEMHGTLPQNARTRNLAAFSTVGRRHSWRPTSRRRHPRRRGHAGDPCRSARRAQGVPAPIRSHRPWRGRRHRRHPGHRERVRRRAPAGPKGRHQPDHDVGEPG